MHFFLLKSLKSSCYNKNFKFKRLSYAVLIQQVSIYHSEIEGVDRGGGGTGVEGAESGVEGAGSGGRGGGERG